MASTAAGGSTSYGGDSGGGGGGGAGGKYPKAKRPFNGSARPPPYARPAALRNPGTANGWLSKLVVDPASKLISASAHLFFSSSLFRKRLPPAPPPPPHIPPPPEANQESRDRFEEEVLDNPPGVQRPFLNDGGTSTNSGKSYGLSELEQMLKQKTFTRSEIDRLTELLHSRTVDAPQGDEDTRTELNVPQPLSTAGIRHELTHSPMQANGIEPHLESHKFHGRISTPGASSLVPEEDVAAPSELAKVYMGSKPSIVSPSRFGLRSQALREDANVLNNGPYTPKSPVMSLVSKPAVRIGVPENGFITPRSRGRSAIYSMARTPYSRVNPTSIQKGTGPAFDGYGGQSPSSSQFPWEHDGLYSSKQLALKRRSSALEDNIGSMGPIRRLRQKTNLSTPKSLSLQAPGSSFSSRGAGVGPDSTELHLSSAYKLHSSDDSKHRTSKALGQNEDNSMPCTSYTPVPSKSTEMATKILQQLDRLVPKEKSPEGKAVAAREKSTGKLTNSTTKMVNGQALRSLEDVDSSNSMHNEAGTHKFKDMGDTSLFDARDTNFQKQDKVENGPKMHMVPSDALTPSRFGNAPVSSKEAVAAFKIVESVSTQKFVTQPSQSKWGFQMSAHEDFLDLDDEIRYNKAASTLLAEGTQKVETSVVESKVLSSEAVTVDKTSLLSDSKQHANTGLGKAPELEASDGTVIGDKKAGFTFPMALPSSTTFQLVSKSTSAFDQIVPPKEPNAPAPLFSFGPKGVGEIPSPFSYSSSINDSAVLKSSAPLEPQPESATSLANVASATDTVPGIPESDKGGNTNLQKSGDTVEKSEASFSSALSTSTSTGNIFSFSAPPKSTSLNGSLGLSSSILASPSPALASSILANSFTTVASSTSTMAANGTASNGSQSTSAAGPLFPTAPIFQFGATPVAPTNSVSTVSTISAAEPIDVKAKTEKKETIFGNLTGLPFGSPSFAMASTGSNIFGFSAPASSSTTDNHSQGSLFGTSSVSMPFQFGSSASSTISGTTETPSLTASTSPFGSSTSSGSLFGLPAPKPIDSSSGFGLSSLATNSNSSSGPTSSLSTWQPPKSSIFSSTTESPATVFPFGASAVSAAATNSAPMVFGSSSGSLFSFTSAAAAAASASSSQMLPVFGSGDQMNMEDSMAEDQPIQASAPTVPVFGQTPISNPSSEFVFGSAVPSAGNPFQFGGQQNQSTPQNPSPFQTSGSLDFATAGNSFSLGSTGDDKANRRIVKVKHRPRRR
ncbi:nuclear pore complex protein NUP1-like isoform X2 [Rhododendron vialii]|uniref:nuclear pore complex protein NUP1-like isoform X2 n=1 Tax=Rhododendron vialii TaxID=182163 RepID=UPI00265EF225|nr:nuclear pore complex protein NUP1-like isoform X2 [Rhododendron vialii]